VGLGFQWVKFYTRLHVLCVPPVLRQMTDPSARTVTQVAHLQSTSLQIPKSGLGVYGIACLSPSQTTHARVVHSRLGKTDRAMYDADSPKHKVGRHSPSSLRIGARTPHQLSKSSTTNPPASTLFCSSPSRKPGMDARITSFPKWVSHSVALLIYPEHVGL
jgi:hypothetical protein